MVIRMFEGRFGRLELVRLSSRGSVQAHAGPALVMAENARELRFLNAGERHAAPQATRALVFHGAADWLSRSFPAVFAPSATKPFRRAAEAVTPRIRKLADALAVEVLNDQFLSSERIEFLLQELMLSIVEAYFTADSAAWTGSRFADGRIRRALALLRERPNKEMSIDNLADAVGLSRSRFYNLFQLCTGLSPRAYLDMLCVEAAITRLSSGEGRISDLSAELGFSAQSNFTRFFLQKVGVPPSEYRRSATARSRAQPPA